jgi:hypothetical protein
MSFKFEVRLNPEVLVYCPRHVTPLIILGLVADVFEVGTVLSHPHTIWPLCVCMRIRILCSNVADNFTT